MKNKLFRPGEVITIRTNLDIIEKTLGGPIPGGVIDVSELKDHILTTGEVLTYCTNIENIRKNSHRNYRPDYPTKSSTLEMIIGFTFLGIGAVLVLLDLVFGIRFF